MKYAIAFTALVIATAFQRLTWPVQTGIGISLFAGLFIFTVMTARRSWKVPTVIIDLMNLAGVLILIAATAVVLIALADDGLTVMDVVRILTNVYL